ncbi:recombination-associated protein RdgC, partial [Kingella kingae]|uniref:recombination-associated protein RdgC n=1 Tax=Kingella kingae TaxID=504 RepID=UPI002E35B5B3
MPWKNKNVFCADSVIKDAVEQKITHIVQNECRPVGRKERIELKEQVIDELL